MKRIFTIAAALLCTTIAWGQRSLRDAVALVQGGATVKCSYSYSLKGDFPLSGKGTAVLSNGRYHISENGIDTYCDGITTWTVDAGAKEVVVSGSGNSIISRLDELLPLVRNFRYNGETLSCSVVSKEQGIDLDFRADGITTGPAPDDGSLFSFDTGALDKSWIITDLR